MGYPETLDTLGFPLVLLGEFKEASKRHAICLSHHWKAPTLLEAATARICTACGVVEVSINGSTFFTTQEGLKRIHPVLEDLSENTSSCTEET